MLQPCPRNVGLAGFLSGTSEDHGNEEDLLTLGRQRCKDIPFGRAVAIGLWWLLRMIIGYGRLGKGKKLKKLRISFQNWRPQLDHDHAPTPYQNHIRQQLQSSSRVTADLLEQILIQAAQKHGRNNQVRSSQPQRP